MRLFRRGSKVSWSGAKRVAIGQCVSIEIVLLESVD